MEIILILVPSSSGGESRKSRRNAAVGPTQVSPTGRRCAMKAENSMGGRYFYAALLVVYYFLFRNFVATRNAYSIIVEACSVSNNITM